jgi:hypothetical protein
MAMVFWTCSASMGDRWIQIDPPPRLTGFTATSASGVLKMSRLPLA